MPPTLPNRRIVLKKRSEVPFGAICVNNFWILKALRRADRTKNQPFELEYASDSADIRLTYVEDPISECTYVIVSGRDQEGAIRIIEKKLKVWTDQEIFEAWTQATNDSAQISAILRLGVAAPFEYDEEFAKYLNDGLSNTNAEVREATLAAIGYRDWPEFDSVLKNITERDSNERCKKRAAHMLEVRSLERSPLHD